MSHPDPHGKPDRSPIQIGEIWENPITRERATILELPWKNQEGRAAAELTALVGARVMGEHRHPGLVERFIVLEGELTVKLARQTTVLPKGKTGCRRAGRVARLAAVFGSGSGADLHRTAATLRLCGGLSRRRSGEVGKEARAHPLRISDTRRLRS
jgi:hypothetical protein